MCNFEFSITTILSTIIIVNSERWYSASLHERDPGYRNKNTDYIQTNEQRYKPLVVMKHEPEKHNHHKPETEDGAVENLTTKSDYFTAENVMIDYNHTINNLNILRRVRPKRKSYRKRCPASYGMKQEVKPKFLQVFQVVNFDHVSCTSSSGLEGTCLHEYECKVSSGTAMGSCADGYGTCCVSQLQCETRSAAKAGWFTNPNYPLPSTARLSCTLTLDKASNDIKQIRLDFIRFELLPPVSGVCQKDQFIVSGQNMNNIVPILCGINTGQHVYVEVGEIAGPIFLSLQTDSAENRLFAIKVSQLTSSDKLAAPTGCLQYFMDNEGYIESFNYRDKSDIGIARTPNYLNNLNYAICIQRGSQTCSVTYANARNMQIVNYDIDGLPIIPPGQAGVEILNCPSDWLLIAATRVCGDRLNDGSVFQDFSLNAPITDYSAGPIVIWFRSDESYVGYGFKLLYQQNMCSSREVN